MPLNNLTESNKTCLLTLLLKQDMVLGGLA